MTHTIREYAKKKPFILVFLIIILSLTLVAMLRQQDLRSRAISSSLEAEQGVRTGIVVVGLDNAASNGQYVQFGNTNTSPQPTDSLPLSPSPNNGYRVQGNKFLDSNNQVHVFRGVDRPSLEWDANGENISAADFQKMKSWKANVVRLATCDVFWVQDENGYKQRLQNTVQMIRNTGMDVVIDLHRSHPQSANCDSQQDMPDRTNSTIFWRDMARLYKNDGKILFELYNEPRNVTCDVWKNGGTNNNWAGMQELVNLIRTEGAQNIILVGGLDWAFDINRCYATHKITGTNIAYASHPYKCDNCSQKDDSADWNAKIAPVAESSPVVLTEFGDFSSGQPANCDDQLMQDVIAWAESKGISWTAWAWWAGSCSFPSLIKTWDGTPNAPGRAVQEFLNRN